MTDPLNTADWMTAWAEARDELLRRFAAPVGTGVSAGGIAAGAGEGADAIRRILEFGEAYLGIAQDAPVWSQSLSSGREELRAGLRDRYARLFSVARMPGVPPGLPLFGPIGAQQDVHERLIAATVRCQRAAQRFNALLTVVAADAVDRMLVALSTTDDAHPPITSLGELHELWVDCGEQAYAAAARGEEFADAQREVLAATIEWRSEQQRLAKSWAKAFDLPTLSDIDTINERVHALSRRVGELERELAQSGKARP